MDLDQESGLGVARLEVAGEAFVEAALVEDAQSDRDRQLELERLFEQRGRERQYVALGVPPANDRTLARLGKDHLGPILLLQYFDQVLGEDAPLQLVVASNPLGRRFQLGAIVF